MNPGILGMYTGKPNSLSLVGCPPFVMIGQLKPSRILMGTPPKLEVDV